MSRLNSKYFVNVVKPKIDACTVQIRGSFGFALFKYNCLNLDYIFHLQRSNDTKSINNILASFKIVDFLQTWKCIEVYEIF